MELAIAGVLIAILLFCVSKILPRISAYGEKLDEKEQKRLEEVRLVREEERKRRLEESREQADLFYSDLQEIVDKHNASSDKKIEVAATLPSGGARDVGFKSTEDAMQSHPDLKAVFAINDPSALGAYAALKKAGVEKQVTIIGFDGQPEGKKAILEGKIYADPIQFPDKMGVEIVNSIVAHSKGESVPAENLIAPALYKKEDAEKDPALKSGE